MHHPLIWVACFEQLANIYYNKWAQALVVPVVSGK
jgi:hypothetical protein